MWRAKVDGYYGWSYYEPYGEGLNVFDTPYQDAGVTAYTEEKGIMPTLMWEVDREAINDYRYLRTLEKIMAERTSDKVWMEEVAVYLETLKVKYSDNGMAYYANPPAEEDFEALRTGTAALITKGLGLSEVTPAGGVEKPGGSGASASPLGGSDCSCRVGNPPSAGDAGVALLSGGLLFFFFWKRKYKTG